MAKTARSRQHDERNPPPEEGSTVAERAPDQSATGYNPFLKADDLPEGEAIELTLTGWVRRTVGRFGPQVVIEVTTPGGKTFDFGIKDGSPNHRMIWRGMGRDENKWAGSIVVERKQFRMGNGRLSNWTVEVREVIADNPPF